MSVQQEIVQFTANSSSDWRNDVKCNSADSFRSRVENPRWRPKRDFRIDFLIKRIWIGKFYYPKHFFWIIYNLLRVHHI